MENFKKGENSIKDVRKAIKEFGNLGSISLKRWQTVSVNSEYCWVDNVRYQNIHGTFGFGTKFN